MGTIAPVYPFTRLVSLFAMDFPSAQTRPGEEVAPVDEILPPLRDLKAACSSAEFDSFSFVLTLESVTGAPFCSTCHESFNCSWRTHAVLVADRCCPRRPPGISALEPIPRAVGDGISCSVCAGPPLPQTNPAPPSP